MRDEYMRPICSSCGGILSQVERADYCDCGYQEYYPDAYAPRNKEEES